MTWIQTYTDVAFDLIKCVPADVRIVDIAHALSNLCRFNGHCTQFYSVAQHSFLASYQVPREDALAALMHDAAEAYVGDVVSPLKMMLPDYRKVEDHVASVVRAAFGLPMYLPESIREVDVRMCETERRQLLGYPPPKLWSIPEGTEPYDLVIHPWGSEEACEFFLERFEELTNGAE